MLKATTDERRILTTFFRTVGLHYQLFDRTTKQLKDDYASTPVFLKNLELLKAMKKSDVGLLESACRLGLRNSQKVSWISEVKLPAKSVSEALEQNLVTATTPCIHRLLVILDMPPTTLRFGAEHSDEGEGTPTVTRVDVFTLSDLIDYFTRSLSISRTKDRDKALAGAFTYLLTSTTLDSILFAIDFALAADDRVLGPLDLQKERLLEADDYISNLTGRRDAWTFNSET